MTIDIERYAELAYDEFAKRIEATGCMPRPSWHTLKKSQEGEAWLAAIARVAEEMEEDIQDNLYDGGGC